MQDHTYYVCDTRSSHYTHPTLPHLLCRFHTLMKMSVPTGMVYSPNLSSSRALVVQKKFEKSDVEGKRE